MRKLPHWAVCASAVLSETRLSSLASLADGHTDYPTPQRPNPLPLPLSPPAIQASYIKRNLTVFFSWLRLPGYWRVWARYLEIRKDFHLSIPCLALDSQTVKWAHSLSSWLLATVATCTFNVMYAQLSKRFAKSFINVLWRAWGMDLKISKLFSLLNFK